MNNFFRSIKQYICIKFFHIVREWKKFESLLFRKFSQFNIFFLKSTKLWCWLCHFSKFLISFISFHYHCNLRNFVIFIEFQIMMNVSRKISNTNNLQMIFWKFDNELFFVFDIDEKKFIFNRNEQKISNFIKFSFVFFNFFATFSFAFEIIDNNYRNTFIQNNTLNDLIDDVNFDDLIENVNMNYNVEIFNNRKTNIHYVFQNDNDNANEQISKRKFETIKKFANEIENEIFFIVCIFLHTKQINICHNQISTMTFYKIFNSLFFVIFCKI